MSAQAPREAREQDYDTVVADDLRPAGNGKDCFYCGQPLGSQHKPECVIRDGAGQYTVAIRKNATGEIRHFRYDMAWRDHSLYSWTEGNFSCDCNRQLFFWRAADEDEGKYSCGSEAFTCLYAELPNGERIPIDDDSPAPTPDAKPYATDPAYIKDAEGRN